MAPQESHALVFTVMFAALIFGLCPTASSADDSARISRLESEIQLLGTRVDEAYRRIQRLEDELARRTSDPIVGTTPAQREGGVAAQDQSKSGRQPWHSPEAWAHVREGMTEAEVTAILGEPTQVEAVDSYKTLFYRRAHEGSGLIGGHVNLRDGRVVAVNKPQF